MMRLFTILALSIVCVFAAFSQEDSEVSYSYYNSFTLDVGYASFLDFPIGQISAPLEDHLLTGVLLELSFVHYINEHFGFGLKTSNYSSTTVQRSNSTLSTEPLFSSGVASPSEYRNSLNTPYIGPVLSLHSVWGKSKNELILNYSFGFMRSIQVATIEDIYEESAFGNIVATSIDLSYSFCVFQRYLLGVEVSYLRGLLLKEKYYINGEPSIVYDYELFSYPKISRIDVSLKFGFKI